MADVERERITALWREAAARLAPAFDEMDAEALRSALGDAWADPLHGWEAAEIENTRLRAECGRLREQLDAARTALAEIDEWIDDELVDTFDLAPLRAALGG